MYVETKMIENEKIIWRIIAIIGTLTWAIVFFAVNAFASGNEFRSIGTLLQGNIIYCFSIAISIALIFFPLQFYLYAIMFWAWGLLGFIGASGTNAILMYLLGCAFAYRMFSAKNREKKCLIMILPLVIAIALQYRLGEGVLVGALLRFLFLLMIFTLIGLLYVHPFVQKNKAQPTDKILLANFNLSEAEFQLLSALLREEKYKTISLNEKISESSVKQRIRVLLEKIGAENRGHLLALYKNNKIIFPE